MRSVSVFYVCVGMGVWVGVLLGLGVGLDVDVGVGLRTGVGVDSGVGVWVCGCVIARESFFDLCSWKHAGADAAEILKNAHNSGVDGRWWSD